MYSIFVEYVVILDIVVNSYVGLEDIGVRMYV